MATNVDKLREGLKNYNENLNVHLYKLQSDFDSLMHFFEQFHHEYEGQAAEEFNAAWEHTARWFDEYMTSVQNLSKTLEERIESLNSV